SWKQIAVCNNRPLFHQSQPDSRIRSSRREEALFHWLSSKRASYSENAPGAPSSLPAPSGFSSSVENAVHGDLRRLPQFRSFLNPPCIRAQRGFRKLSETAPGP